MTVCISSGVFIALLCMHTNFRLELRCPDLENPADGSVVYDGLVVGSQATYSCNDGYRLVGSSTRTCEIDGTWSGESPLCSQSGN